MNKKQKTFWIVAIIFIVLFSILLSGVVQDIVVLPIVKFFWILKGYYGSVRQETIWGLVVTIIIIIAGFSLRAGSLSLRSRTEYEKKILSEVGELSYWIRRSKYGLYPRWYVARALAEVALELLRQRGVNAEHRERLKGPDWTPPMDVQVYLETALRSTPGSFARQLKSANMAYDPKTESIVEYLESYAENSND